MPFLSHSQHKKLLVGEKGGRGRARKILTLFVLVLKFIHVIQSARLNHSSFVFCSFETSAFVSIPCGQIKVLGDIRELRQRQLLCFFASIRNSAPAKVDDKCSHGVSY